MFARDGEIPNGYTYWSIRNLKSTENCIMRVANMSISSELANCWRGNMKNGFELTGSGSGFDRYMSCSQYSVAWRAGRKWVWVRLVRWLVER